MYKIVRHKMEIKLSDLDRRVLQEYLKQNLEMKQGIYKDNYQNNEIRRDIKKAIY